MTIITTLRAFFTHKNILIALHLFVLVQLYFIQHGVIQVSNVFICSFLAILFAIDFYKIVSKFMSGYTAITKALLTWAAYLLSALISTCLILFLFSLAAEVFNNYGCNFQEYYNSLPYLSSMVLIDVALLLCVFFWDIKLLKQFVDPLRYPAMVLMVISIIVSLLFLESLEQVIYEHVLEVITITLAEILGLYQLSSTNHVYKLAVSNVSYFIRVSAYGIALFFAFMHIVS